MAQLMSLPFEQAHDVGAASGSSTVELAEQAQHGESEFGINR
jgi:precorrin-6B methylase 2